MNNSAILQIELVTEMGRIWLSTCVAGNCFGSGVTLDNFQLSGTMPCRTDVLIIAQIGAASVRDSRFDSE